jgi:hypothetical protein
MIVASCPRIHADAAGESILRGDRPGAWFREHGPAALRARNLTDRVHDANPHGFIGFHQPKYLTQAALDAGDFAQVTTLRVALGTVPGTVQGVVLGGISKGVFPAITRAISSVILAAIWTIT